MVGTRKLAPLLEHAERAGAKVVLVGDDLQFASIQAGGGFRALRLGLGASELTVNRRQVEAWEQRAIDDIRAGHLEQAIAAARWPALTIRPPPSTSPCWKEVGGGDGSWPRPDSGWSWPSTHSARPLGRRTRRPSGWACCGGRSSDTWAGWKPTMNSYASRSARCCGRMPGGAGSTSGRSAWTRPAGWWPNSARCPAILVSGRCGAWPPRNWTATGAATAWTT